jgi:hypothetical protein
MNLLALALVKGMVWKMAKELFAAIKRDVDIFQENLEKSSVTMDIVCFSKSLTDKFHII